VKGSWWVDFMFNHERLRKRSPLNTKSGAAAFEVQLRQLVAQHGTVDAALAALEPKQKERVVTFREYAREWLASYVRNNNRLSERKGKASILHRHLFPHLGDLPLREIQRGHIEAYKTSKLEEELSPKTINNHLTVLGKCLRMAKEDELLTTLPLIQWLEVRPQDFDFLMPVESHQLLSDRVEPQWTDLARLAVRTGLRRGELIALDWSAINLSRASLTVRVSRVYGVLEAPKNNRIRRVPLTEDVVAMLARRTLRTGLVFPRSDGGPLSIGVMRQGLLRLCRRTGMRHIGWHVLRHTFASQLAMEGVPLISIKELMGHSTIQMTMRYSHLSPSTLAQAVPALLRAESRALEENCQPVVNRSDFPPPVASAVRNIVSYSWLNQTKNAPGVGVSLVEPIPGVEPE